MNSKVKIKITGKNPKNFLKELIVKKINVYQVEQEEKSLIIIIEEKDYQELKKRKTIYKIQLVKYYGLARIKYLVKKYSIFLIFSLLGIGIIFFLSTRIWKIEIITSNQQLKSLLKKDLQELGITLYHQKTSYKKREEIKNILLEKEKDKIEWLEIDTIGTKYIIRVEERKKKEEKKECLPRHIIAKKNAIITKIEATTGEIVKKKNDYVEKGSLIISGWIHNKDIVVSKKCVKGKVYGQVWYKVKIIVPNTKKEKIKTTKHIKGISLTIFKNSYNFHKKYRLFQKKQYNIIEDKIIPISLSVVDYQKLKQVTKKLSKKEIEQEAIQIATKQIKKNLKSDEKIISKKVLKKEEKNSKIEVDIFLEVEENITDYFDINNIPIEEMNKKEE